MKMKIQIRNEHTHTVKKKTPLLATNHQLHSQQQQQKTTKNHVKSISYATFSMKTFHQQQTMCQYTE